MFEKKCLVTLKKNPPWNKLFSIRFDLGGSLEMPDSLRTMLASSSNCGSWKARARVSVQRGSGSRLACCRATGSSGHKEKPPATFINTCGHMKRPTPPYASETEANPNAPFLLELCSSRKKTHQGSLFSQSGRLGFCFLRLNYWMGWLAEGRHL